MAMDSTRVGAWHGVAVLGLLLLAGCGGSSSEPQTGTLTLCRDKVAEMSVDGLRYQVKGARSCQGCQEVQDTLLGYDCVTLAVTAGGLFRRSGSFGKVGVYEGTLELESLQIHEWKVKRNGF